MIRFISPKHVLSRVLVIAVVVGWCASLAAPALAQEPEPPPPPPNPITQIFQYVIQFPTDSLVEALTQAIQAILTKSIEPLEQVFSASLAKWVTASPGILTPGGGIADGVDVMTPAWNLTSRIAILLWPLTLALTAVIAAKDVVAARAWGIGDLKQALGTWLLAVILSATSLYWMDLANRFVNATTSAILNLSFSGAAGFDPNGLTAILIGSAVIVLGVTGLGILIAILILIVGVSILAALILQFLARFALLYVLVALAPIVIMLGVLPPMRWFTYTWLRGFVLVLAIGPINALLLKLVMVLGVRGISNEPITAFVNFMAAAGVLSALLTVNYTLIRFVFGAMGQVVQRAVGTVTAVGTLALGAVAGVAAAGAVGGAGAAAGAGGGSPIGGGGILSSPRAFGTGLETAGSVMARSGGFGRGFGAALWGVGNAMRQSSRNGSSPNAAHSQGGSASQNTPPSPNGSNGSAPVANRTTQSPRASAQTTRTQQASSSNSTPSYVSTAGAPQTSQARPPQSTQTPSPSKSNPPNRSGAATTQTAPPPHPPTPTVHADDSEEQADLASNTQTQSVSAQLNPETTAPTQATKRNPSTNPAPAPMNPSGSNATRTAPTVAPPSPQSASTSAPLANRARVVQHTTEITPEARSLISVLDSPLDERVRDLAQLYAGNPTQQITAVQGAVAALSALESQHNVEPQELAASWDQTLGPVLISAREGLSLEAMANDSGYRGDVTQYLGARVESGLLAARQAPHAPLFPRVESPQAFPWHPQLSPHDVEVGQQVATLLAAPPDDAQAFAHIYHAIRSPENGGGWNAGVGFRNAAREVTNLEPAKRFGAFDARLHAMEQQGTVSSNALRPWRVHLSRAQSGKD